MKVKMGKYPNYLTCDIHTKYMNKKYDFMDWPEKQTNFENILEKIEDFIQGVYNVTFNKLVRKEQKVSVKIDPWDTWGMCYTLAYIVLPMLKQLQETKQGAPDVDPMDVPEELRAPEGWYEQYSQDEELDELFFKRWDWVLGEMIWAFEQKVESDNEDQFFIDVPVDKSLDPTSLKSIMSGFTVDREGLEVHNKRMANGFVLFGKYYQNLWD